MNKKEKRSFFDKKVVIGLGAGLYPLFHYYNGNFDIADTWYQLGFFLGISIVLPLALIAISHGIMKLSATLKHSSYWLTAINLAVFSGLLAFFIFLFDGWTITLFVVMAIVLSLRLHRFISKIVILQYLLAVMSLFTLVPKLMFMWNHSNEWAETSDGIDQADFKVYPNIYVIQPDGFTNFSELRKPPYNYEDPTFEQWLEERNFVNYPNFRSNYYSTLTSNSSMFAMKHHYYNNTYPGNLKTFGSQAVIVGDNNWLRVLKHNGYKTHLITDNSFFLTNRKLEGYDFCNIPQSEVLLHDTGGIPGVRTVREFIDILDAADAPRNFYFIEKTTPGHIKYTDASSGGPEVERERYLHRLKTAESWTTQLVKNIQRLDPNPLIVIVADHGGFVGLNSVKEVHRRKLDSLETISVFSSQLSIHWPYDDTPDDLVFRSNVNVFRNIIAYLSQNKSFLDNREPDESFLPFYEGQKASYFLCIDDNGTVEYRSIE